MSTERNGRFLSVVTGGGEGDGRRIGQLIALDPALASNVRPPNVLRVPVRSATIVSIGIDGLDFTTFCETLQKYEIRRITDIRLLASFHGQGFDSKMVFQLFREHAITYERSLDLNNRFIGESANEHIVFNLFLAYLKNNEEPLRRLQTQVAEGPLLLLGRAAEHQNSERDAVVQALACLGANFDLITNPTTERVRFKLDG